MRDVAAVAGVSLKTVSRVVNEEAGVSPALAGRVRAAIDELGFRPNVGARVLRLADGRTSSIGLLLDDVANPFASSIQRAVEDVALPRGVVVFSASIDEDAERERRLAATFAARRADGLILVPTGDDQSYLAGEVRVGHRGRLRRPRAAQPRRRRRAVDPRRRGDRGRAPPRRRRPHPHRLPRRPGDDQHRPRPPRRLPGRARGGRAGLRPGARGAGPADRRAGGAGRPRALPPHDPPTALFTARNAVTIGAIRALHRFGRQRLVAVVGFDDFLTADLLSPGITVVAQDPSAIGRRAAGLLFTRDGGGGGAAVDARGADGAHPARLGRAAAAAAVLVVRPASASTMAQ